MILSIFNFDMWNWIIIPILIFLTRILDVSIGTVRLIFISRGMKKTAPLLGFFEVLIWVVVVKQVLVNLKNPVCYIAYAAGFAAGTYVGMIIEEQFSKGKVVLTVITRKDSSELINALKEEGYRVTLTQGEGSSGIVNILFTIINKKKVFEVVEIIKKFNPKSFYTIEDVKFASDKTIQESRFKYLKGFPLLRKGK
ncbi:MAG: DUF2179 domain-containing protein [Nanoarchaeota archaeon]|nr:DUF2179 domain-containing protein [Nanoarchaeota archaeon]MBU1854240.1 DUF2179 domain-containing protein [Nanoarchaeota archaeon]